MGAISPEYQASSGTFTPTGEVRQRGVAGKFLESKGFGWLMEVDEGDEEGQKPLL